MSWTKHKVLVFGGGLAVVLLIAVGVMLIKSAVDYRHGQQELGQQTARLEALRSRQPFPSAENSAALEDNLDRMEFCAGELAAELMQDPFFADPVDVADFSARAQEVIELFRERANRAGVILPEGLEAGFARYSSGGAVPAPEHVARLVRQLYSVERVADVLVQCGVSSIREVSRDPFELVAEALPTGGDRRRPRREKSAALMPPPHRSRIASSVHSGGLYSIERIRIGFSAKEHVVWDVLGQFASASHFMVIKEFSHSTQSSILSYNPTAVTREAGAVAETSRFLAGGVLSGSEALSRPERIIAGDELLEVKITVDVFNFDPAVFEEISQ